MLDPWSFVAHPEVAPSMATAEASSKPRDRTEKNRMSGTSIKQFPRGHVIPQRGEPLVVEPLLDHLFIQQCHLRTLPDVVRRYRRRFNYLNRLRFTAGGDAALALLSPVGARDTSSRASNRTARVTPRP